MENKKFSMQEVFLDIEGYEGLYQISNFGNVRSFKGKKPRILRPSNPSSGYYYVQLCKNKKVKTHTIHRLVAIHFIHNPKNLPEVDHRDGNKSNNAAYNLEWVTRIENVQRAWENGLCENTRKVAKKYLSKPVAQYDLNGKLIATYSSTREAERQTGIRHISECCNGLYKTVGGYIWRYIKELC